MRIRLETKRLSLSLALASSWLRLQLRGRLLPTRLSGAMIAAQESASRISAAPSCSVSFLLSTTGNSAIPYMIMSFRHLGSALW